MKFPKITVSVATYNSAKTLARTLDSIVNQTYQNIEVVVADGASIDGTIDILKDYCSRYSNTRYVSERDKGIPDAINKTQKMATGDYFIFLGADDIFYKSDVVEKFVALQNDVDSVYYGDVFFETDKRIYDGPFSTFQFTKKNLCHQAVFYPKWAYKNYDYNLKYKLWSDYDYNIRVWAKSKFKRIELTVVLYSQEGSTSSTVDKVFLQDKPKLIKQYFGFPYYVIALLQYAKGKLFRTI